MNILQIHQHGSALCGRQTAMPGSTSMSLSRLLLFCSFLQLAEIQSRLLDVGSAVATPADSSSQSKLARVAFPGSATAEVEVSKPPARSA
jgi:hypothetical protein